ncbi:MAG: DUF5683 domain-containing protein [Bergeyella zoohelcum]|nr:DUF5683 domain-containing protein [Bergeyella zoohelcum]
MRKLLFIWCVFVSSVAFSQVIEKDTITSKPNTSELSSEEIVEDIEKDNAPTKKMISNPTKAGLYSAVLPGLGQYYNKKYWKISIVWGGIGTGIGIALWNNKQYNRYRNAYVASLNGLPHEFSSNSNITSTVLGNAQDSAKRQRDYSIAITALVYILGIMDAVVDAHLYEQRKDPDLAVKPTILYDEFGRENTKIGLSFNLKF